MVVWIRQSKEGVAIPDGIIRRADWLAIGNLDTAFCTIEEMRAETLANAEQEADSIIEAAHQEAEEIRLNAEALARQMFDDARADGLQAGVDEWTKVMLSSTREAHQQIRQQRERMARIVIAAVEKIVPLQDPQGIYRQVLKILSKSIEAVRYVTLRVAPDEVEYAETSLREIADGSALGRMIEVAGDERLSRGACLVESDQGIIDLSLNSQLKALRAAIFLSVGEPKAPVVRHAEPAESEQHEQPEQYEQHDD